MNKVSIIIPTYNMSKFVMQAIDSAICQDYADIEIIVVDDGSTDETFKILNKKYKSIKILRKQNGGTGSALNMGIRMSNGDWIKWLSADDILLSDAVSNLMKHALAHPSGTNCIFYSPYYYIDENGNQIDEFKEPDYNSLPKEELDMMLLDHFIGNGSTSLIHRSVFEKCGYFDESLLVCDDYEFWLRCCLIHGIRLWRIPEITLKYRIHNNQLTKKWGQDVWPIINKFRNIIRQQCGKINA